MRTVRQAPVGDGLRACPAQRCGLGPAACLGDRLGISGEQDREPEPDADLELEPLPDGPVTGSAPVMLAIQMIVTRAAVISTTNITGLRIRAADRACERRAVERREGAAGP